ncbi:hypothetical protein M1293_03275 [Candidatus Parvarchaeota archaeon]|nr:hypothetical protein [Candidatus Parvarchaeota archaeon]
MEFENSAFVGQRELAVGLKLAGIKETFIASDRQAVEIITKFIREKRYSLVISQESIMEKMNGDEIFQAETSMKPIVVFLPDVEQRDAEESVRNIAKKVLGFDIERLKV